MADQDYIVDQKYVVIRIANGYIANMFLYDSDCFQDVLEKAKLLYEKYSKSGKVQRDLEPYITKCLYCGHCVEIPFPGMAYEKESIVIWKVVPEKCKNIVSMDIK